MTGKAAEELVDLIMLDDFVARREALRRWEERWMATMHLETEFMTPLKLLPLVEKQAAIQSAVKTMTKKMLNGLSDDSQHVTQWYYGDDRVVLQIAFVRMEPHE